VPRQNRVTPTGDIVAAPERGTLMGNRGVLHDDGGHIRRAWQSRRWIACALAFGGRRRQVMAPGRYTELFFVDEATALAAGHRPCAECRRGRFTAFRAAWGSAHPGAGPPAAGEMDRRLHEARVGPGGAKRSYAAALDGLPDGVFVTAAAWGGRAYLVWGDRLLAWAAGGYAEGMARPKGAEVQVLTPRPTVGVIRAGYAPEVQPSAGAPAGSYPGGLTPLYRDRGFAFRFDTDRLVPRFHLEGVAAGLPVSVYGIDPGTGERLGLLATATVGEGGWVDLGEPIIVRAGEAFVAVPRGDEKAP
jgi:hypothetical protein